MFLSSHLFDYLMENSPNDLTTYHTSCIFNLGGDFMRKIISKTNLYVATRDAILDAIKEGEIAQNDRLPSEETLSEMFSVSRTTIRNALQSLQNDGLINKRHGTEATVNRVCLGLNIRIDEAKGFSDLIAASGHKPGVIYNKLEKEIVDPKIARKLSLKKGSECLVLTELLSGDDDPVVFLREYYPFSTLNRIPELSRLPSDIYKLSDSYFNKSISYTIREISAVKNSESLLKAMQLNSGVGFIKMEETHYSDDDKVIAYNETFLRDSIMKLQVVCRRP